MKYIIDRIYDNQVVVEDQTTKKMITLNKNLLPQNIHEGTILIYKNNTYQVNSNLEQQRRISIQEKFNRLRNKSQ